MPIFTPSNYARPREPNFFGTPKCETKCALYEACGGSSAAPCTCVWKDPEKRHNCEECHLVCRERRDVSDPYHTHLQSGAALADISLRQDSYTFPLLIPTRTRDLKKGIQLRPEWAGITLKNLLSEGRGKGRVSDLLTSAGALKEKLRLSENTKLLAVLNGKDYQLEAFWGMERKDLYRHLSALGFSGVTGPTFSITSEFDMDPITPASHNVLMLRRHHQVVAELQLCTEAAVVPNIYWRNEQDRNRWTEWLNANVEVSIVSRDFSMTRTGLPFDRELQGFLQIIEPVNRRLHVLLLGVAAGNAYTCLRRLAAHGCTASIVTGDPIMTAINGGNRLVARSDGRLLKSHDREVERSDLALSNLHTMVDYLSDITSDLPVYSTHTVVH